MFFDTHAHLQWSSFDRDREEVLLRARGAQVDYVVNIGFDVNGSMKGVKLADHHEELYATVGVHPHNASHLDDEALDELRRLSENPKVVAIGEIGLDYYRNLSPRETQKKAFEVQLLLAEELELPVVIHNREAHSDILGIISSFKGKLRGVMHCFSGSREMAEQCIRLGYLISLAGTVTYPNAHRLHEIAKWIDLQKILLETDSPWLAPQDMRGRRNEPSFLPFTAKKVAGLRGINLGDLAAVTTENAENIFKLK
ncbi:MAG: TatD family hydrolase [Candidatus Hodarchaeota archaeon]